MKIIKGNLIQLAKDGEFDIIVHGANCFNTMNSGIAKQIRENFPEVYEVDRNTIKGDIKKLGTFTLARVVSHQLDMKNMDSRFYVPFKQAIFYVVNAYTQYKYGTDKVNFDADAFIRFLYTFKNYIKLMYDSNVRKNEIGRFNDERVKLEIGFPRIGCGLGGGDWEYVKWTLLDFSDEVSEYANITIVEL